MDNKKNDDIEIEQTPEWGLLSQKVFRLDVPPPSELFVARVMARIDQEEQRDVTAAGETRTVLVRWGLSILGFSLASWLLFLTLSASAQKIALNDLLFQNGLNPDQYSESQILDL